MRAGECLQITLQDNDDFRLYSFVPTGECGDTYPGRTDLFMGGGIRETKRESD